MNAEVVNKFLSSTGKVLSEYFNIQIEQAGPPVMIKGSDPLDPITILLGITGDLEGQFILGFPRDVGLGFARQMMMNPDYPEFDDLCKSALSELGNMIAGLSSTALADMGYACNISPPTLLMSQGGTLDVATPTLICLPIRTSEGSFKTNISLVES